MEDEVLEKNYILELKGSSELMDLTLKMENSVPEKFWDFHKVHS